MKANLARSEITGGSGSQCADEKSIALFDDLTATVHAGLAIDMMRAHGFAGVLVFDPVNAFQRMVGTAHIALRFRCFSLWYSHDTYPLSVTDVFDTGK